jgi:hypothetical protein
LKRVGREHKTGVDVMITIFCDFCQFSSKKLAFFLKNQFYDQFFQKLAVVGVKNANFFAKFLGDKIHNIGPRSYHVELPSDFDGWIVDGERQAEPLFAIQMLDDNFALLKIWKR